MVLPHRLTRGLVVIFVPIMLFISLASWALASPVGASPDDDYHMASIWCGGGIREGLCEPGDAPNQRRVPSAVLEASSCFAFKADMSASCPLKPSSVLANTSRGNFDAGGYPPLFYATMSVFAGPGISVSITLMRLFNALLFVGMTTILFLLLPQGRRGPLIWGGAVSIVPLGMFLIPSVNPSSWALISAFTLWISLTAYFTEERWPRKAAFGALATVATLIGAGARSDAAVYGVLAMMVAVVLSFRWERRYALLAILPITLALVSVALFLTAGQSGVLNPDAFDDNAGFDAGALIVQDLQLLPQLWIGALGFWGLGWLDTMLPGIVWVTMVAVYFAAIFWGVQKLGWRKGLSLAMVLGSLVVVPMYILIHDRVIIGSYVQPRYIYPLLVMFAGLAIFGLSRDTLRMSRIQLTVMAFAIFIANAVALHLNIRRYVAGTDVVGINLDNTIEWWWGLPVSPMGVWIVGTVAFGLTLGGLVVYASRSHLAMRRLPFPVAMGRKGVFRER
jgi:hypothetical protein